MNEKKVFWKYPSPLLNTTTVVVASQSLAAAMTTEVRKDHSCQVETATNGGEKATCRSNDGAQEHHEEEKQKGQATFFSWISVPDE